MAHDASQNKPMKELSYALIGLGAFLALVLLIGVSAYLRPAGVHIAPEPVVAPDAAEVAGAETTAVPATSTAAPDAGATADNADNSTSADTGVASATATASTPAPEAATADAEPSQSSAEAVAANTDADKAEASISNESGINENLRSDDVVVAEDMSIGGEGAVTK